MPAASISVAHLDYLQRASLDPGAQPIDASVTHALPAGRRLWHITEVGRIEKQPAILKDQRARLPSEDALIGSFGYHVPLAFMVRGTPVKTAIHLGTWSPAGRETVSPQVIDSRMGILKSAFDSLYPALKAAPATIDLADLPMGGIALGIPTPKPPDPLDGAVAMDRLIRAMTGSNWACLVLAEPVDESVTSDLRRSVIEEMRMVQVAGQSAEAPLPLLKLYEDLLEVMLETMTTGMSIGMWRTGVYLLGDARSYYRLASLWRGIFGGDQSLPEPVMVWDVPDAARLAASWVLPDASGPPGPGHYRHPLAFQTLLTSQQLAACVHLPELETSGFAVNIVPSFDSVPPPAQGDGIALGHIVLRTQPIDQVYAIRRDDLARHVFVAGVTGAGKTNTIFRLLMQADAADVPFLVVEPAKAEYRALLNDPNLAGRLHVFTLGDERVSPFRLNPFEVLPGVPVGVHLDLLRSVFSVSMGMWTPLPQVLEQCLHAIYEDRGWDITGNTNRRLDADADPSTAFPTLSDLIAKVDEVTKQLGYEDRVTSDIRAALLTRLNALRAGGKGRMLDVRRSLPMDMLLGRPTLLELEGLGDDDDKAFVMGLLLIRLVEHRRAAAKVDGLRHLLVIEEAHRLLTNVSAQGREEEANPRGKAVETFANLLSEIRVYGQGVIIADQIPVKLAPDVIKNTNLKVAHRLVAADDRATIAGAMAMDERQARALATLLRGQAAAFSEGDDAPVLVQIPLAKDQLAQGLPDNVRIARHMRASRELESYRSLFVPLPACAETCAGADAACALASRIVEDPAFQRALARLALSAIEDADAVDRLWSDVVAIVRALRPSHIDETQLLRSIATHAAEWFAQRRGAQAGWSYSQTGALATALRRMLLAKIISPRPDSTRSEFQRLARALHARRFDPFPACSRICRQEPPVCLYRHAAADVITARTFGEAWRTAVALDVKEQDGGRRQTWEMCMDAGFEIIEFAEDNWPAAKQEAADTAARRASLCFGQQMLALDGTRSPTRSRQIVEQLLKEARHE